MALKDGTTSENMLSRGLMSLLDSGKNKASLAAGPAAAAAAAAAALAKHAAPRLDVPSGSFWILLKTKRLQLLVLLLLLLLLLLLVVLLELILQASKTTTSKKILPRGLSSLRDSCENKASSAAGPAAAAAAAGAGA